MISDEEDKGSWELQFQSEWWQYGERDL